MPKKNNNAELYGKASLTLLEIPKLSSKLDHFINIPTGNAWEFLLCHIQTKNQYCQLKKWPIVIGM